MRRLNNPAFRHRYLPQISEDLPFSEGGQTPPQRDTPTPCGESAPIQRG
jgi:hypothetical protein